MARPPLDLSLYLVTDTGLCGTRGVRQTVEDALAGGVTIVQLRDPTCSDADFVALGLVLVKALSGTGVPLLVNDRVHLVTEIGADGAHIGQHDLDVPAARRSLGSAAYLGLSVQTSEQLAAAQQNDPAWLDYLGVGPVWAQSTKRDAAPPCGLDTLAEIAASSSWPCVAIGGIGLGRVASIRRSGAAGVAVVSAICGQPDPAEAARQIRHEWNSSEET